MVYKCCVPHCRGNYSNGPKVHVFSFPRNEEMKKEWISLIHRQDFQPSVHSKVCHTHFKPEDVVWETSHFDERNNIRITAPLEKPRLRRDAIPIFLPECPSCLCTTESTRESRDEKRLRLEKNQSADDSVKHHCTTSEVATSCVDTDKTANERPEEEYAENEDPFLPVDGFYGDKTRRSTRKKCKSGTRATGMGTEETSASINMINDYAAAPTEMSTLVREADDSIEFNNEDPTLPFVNESAYVGGSATLNAPGPSGIRHSKKSQGFLSYITFLKQKEERVSKHKREVLSLKERKLQLENEKLQFERAKFELEKKEREAKLEIERTEHEHRIAMEKKQLEIIELLTKLVNKN